MKVTAVLLLACALPAAAQSPAPASSPTPGASPPPSIAASVEPAVIRFLEEHQNPCALASAKGVPCFPVSTEVRGQRYSVAEDFFQFGRDQHDRTPQTAIAKSPYGTPVSGITFDPVCTAKNALRALQGRNNTYWIYRTVDEHGEQILMRDRALDPEHPPTGGAYELVAKVDGECAALAAWRKADREARARAGK